MTPVVVGSELYGDTVAVALRVTVVGALVEMNYAPPIGTMVTVHFACWFWFELPYMHELVARAKVIGHSLLPGERERRVVSIEFVEFLERGAYLPEELH